MSSQPHSQPPAPSPFHLLRIHTAPIQSLSFSNDNRLLYSGDEGGYLAITDMKKRRVVCCWKGHGREEEGSGGGGGGGSAARGGGEGVLGVSEWDGGLVSHGRDNVIHFHTPLDHLAPSLPPSFHSSRTNPSNTASSSHAPTSLIPLLPPPRVKRSLPVNSLNFCRFHLIEVPFHHTNTNTKSKSTSTSSPKPPIKTTQSSAGKLSESILQEELEASISNGVAREPEDGDDPTARSSQKEGLLAVPNLTDSETVDIYHLPSMQRLHAAVTIRPKDPSVIEISSPAVSASASAPLVSLDGEGGSAQRSGLVMNLQLFFNNANANADADVNFLQLVIAFEDGRVELWNCEPGRWRDRSDMRLGVGIGRWTKKWSEKRHNEAIMAMTVSPKRDWAFSVSADHLLIRYALGTPPDGQPRVYAHSTKQIGNSSVSVTPDGKVVAVGGWDGKIRLFSTKTLKSLGTLAHHREGCAVIAFPCAGGSDRDGGAQAEGVEGAEVDKDADHASDGDSDSDSDEDDDQFSPQQVKNWMASGGKDSKILLWKLMDFEKGRPSG